jgi:thiamine-monophosphate kinase
MQYNEFEIISKYFKKKKQKQDLYAIKGIGDDSALISIPKKHILAISTDTLVESIHFLKNISPEDLAYKTVAVNLSDLAAMGAQPKWTTLSITMPTSCCHWLKTFSDSFFNVLNKYNTTLIGGNTTRGPLSITLSVYGILEKDTGLLRSNANIGDLIYVTGYLGDSKAGLLILKKKISIKNKHIKNYFIKKHLRPIPRIYEGMALKQAANAAIDISDGLIADLGHILKESECGANINLNHIPISKNLRNNFHSDHFLNWAISGGEDYELCFTVSKKNAEQLNFISKKFSLHFTCIGNITESQEGFNLFYNNKKIFFNKKGFLHF